jgi:hypothetical protein
VPAILVIAALAGGCTGSSASRLTNPAAAKCQASLRDAFAVMLVGQQEKPEVAEAVAAAGAQAIADVELGPTPFKLSSPSGLDYGFYIDDEMGRCLVRLVAIQGGRLQVSDNVTFIATRPLPGCSCMR